jgi:hypothetical protein
LHIMLLLLLHQMKIMRTFCTKQQIFSYCFIYSSV